MSGPQADERAAADRRDLRSRASARQRPRSRRSRPAADRHGDHQRADSSVTQPDIERGTIVIRGEQDRGARRERAGARRREGRRRRGRRRLSGLHQRAHDDGAQRAGPARVRRRQRDARLQPAAPHAGGVSRRERRHPGRARQRHHDRRRHAGRRHLRRRGRGDEPRRLDVGGGDAPAERRHHVQLPGARRRRRARWRRWRRRPRRDPNAPTRT